MWPGLDGAKAENYVKNPCAKKHSHRNEPPVAFAFWLSLAIKGQNTRTRCTHHTFFSPILLITRRKKKRSTFTARKPVELTHKKDRRAVLLTVQALQTCPGNCHA